jgi:hypothetical protein
MKARPAEAVVQRARVIARIVYRVTDRNPGWREETVESLEAESLEVESLAISIKCAQYHDLSDVTDVVQTNLRVRPLG